MLRQTLHSIAGQNYPLDKIEVIVISQTPEIENTQLLDDNGLDLSILLRPENETISALRNYGVKQAKGKYLAFLDADIFISPNWINTMQSHLHQNKNRIIVSAMQTCESTAPALEHIRTNLSNAELDTDVAFLPGRNLFLTLESFERIGGFPEHLITCEDYYFTDKAAQLGNLYYTSDATYIHLGEDKNIPEMFKKEIWRGQSNLQSIQGRKVPFREIPSFILPLGVCLSLLISLISFFFWEKSIGLLFLLLGALPLLAYSIRLYRLSKDTVKFGSVLKFYAAYFPARAIGTLAGLFKAIGTNHK